MAKLAAERGRKRSLDEDVNRPRKRSGSKSSFSSVSTISTTLSRSDSPKRPRSKTRDDYYSSQRDRSTSPSYLTPLASKKRRRRSLSTASSHSTESSDNNPSRKRTGYGDRRVRKRHTSRSPSERGRHHEANIRRASSREGSRSRDRSQIARNRRSMTPLSHGQDERGRREARATRRVSKENAGGLQVDRDDEHEKRNFRAPGRPSQHPGQDISGMPRRKDRSLSPFSKRLALTQAMNMRG